MQLYFPFKMNTGVIILRANVQIYGCLLADWQVRSHYGMAKLSQVVLNHRL